ncbi:MAG: Ribonuclease Y [Microgenomates group bacterium GW2011_GWA1_48_10]|nr:MAG: Ribonuclease Y [Microgenomates group bacterium GW2011_GWA1_48_10]
MSLFSRLSTTLNKPKREVKYPKTQEKKAPITRTSSSQLGATSQQAIFQAQTQAREIVFSAKEEAIKIKSQAEDEDRKLRAELIELERRLAQKEESLDTRLRSLEDREKKTTETEKSLAEKQIEVEKIRADQLTRLQKIASLSVEEAKEKIIAAVEEKSRNEAGRVAKGILDEAKEQASAKAREILVSEMLHGATDYVAEYTVSIVSVGSEEVKGRIIGKEGRNIRAFEQATGVDVELDEEGVIRLSSFDSIRREIARVALERLIRDTRIQPARIEEVVAQVRKEIERIMFDEGEKLCHTVGVYNLPRPIVEMLGRFKYRFSYGQNMILHTLEETKVGIAITSEIGADVNVVRLGCLLHDIGKVIESEEGSHVTLGADFLRKMGIPEKVVACVEEHHEDKPFSSVESMIVYLADAISGSRPGARYEDLEKYLARMKQLEEICKSFPGVNDAWVFQAGREVRVLVDPEKMTDNEAVILAQKIKERVESEIKEFPGQIKLTVIRELRITETAK